LTQDDKSIKARGGVYDETGIDGLDAS